MHHLRYFFYYCHFHWVPQVSRFKPLKLGSLVNCFTMQAATTCNIFFVDMLHWVPVWAKFKTLNLGSLDDCFTSPAHYPLHLCSTFFAIAIVCKIFFYVKLFWPLFSPCASDSSIFTLELRNITWLLSQLCCTCMYCGFLPLLLGASGGWKWILESRIIGWLLYQPCWCCSVFYIFSLSHFPWMP